MTESLIFDRLARTFDIHEWPVCAVKTFLGHSMATASGDQAVAALAAMRRGVIPGVKTGTAIAGDVHGERLRIPVKDMEVGAGHLVASFINAKGFGGNNATGVLLSPAQAESMVSRRHSHLWSDYCRRREQVRERARAYESRADRGDLQVIYRFGQGMHGDEDIEIGKRSLVVPGFGKPVNLEFDNPYRDMD